jgi:hypothetical protein
VLVRRLVAASVHDPERFSDQLDGLAGCPNCAKSVLADFSYTMAGLALQDPAQHDADDDRPVGCTCARPANSEVVSMALTSSMASHDSDALGLVLERILPCRVCMLSVLMSLVSQNVSILDDTNLPWRLEVEKELLAMFERHEPACRPVVEKELLAMLDGNA